MNEKQTENIKTAMQICKNNREKAQKGIELARAEINAFQSHIDAMNMAIEAFEKALAQYEDRKSKLLAMFNGALLNNVDELDFFVELLNDGFTLDDIKEFIPEKYDYCKMFMEEHGLI